MGDGSRPEYPTLPYGRLDVLAAGQLRHVVAGVIGPAGSARARHTQQHSAVGGAELVVLLVAGPPRNAPVHQGLNHLCFQHRDVQPERCAASSVLEAYLGTKICLKLVVSSRLLQ